jgi:hypothetical protein
MNRVRLLVFGLWAVAYSARTEAACGMVFGADWAIAFSAPARWDSLCNTEKTAGAGGAALTLWPQGTTVGDAPAVMYVTVNEKNRRSLAVFAADEQQRFRSDKPNVVVRFEPAMSAGGSAPKVVFRATDARNQQLIAYVEGPTRFFVVVMSARSAQALEEHQSALPSLLNSFVAMKVSAERR